MTEGWPNEEKSELASQVRRSSNSAPAQLSEKNDDRHIRNKIEDVNRSRGEAAQKIHHLFMAKLKGYITEGTYHRYRGHYKQCIRMLNGLEKTLERKNPEHGRWWKIAENKNLFDSIRDIEPLGWPKDNPDT